MSVRRPVEVTVERVGGEVAVGARIQATLNKADTDPISGWVIPENVVEYSDSNGRATLNLWPNERGTKGSAYRITATRENGDLIFDVWATVPDETPIFLADIAQPIDCFGNAPSVTRTEEIAEESRHVLYVAQDGDDDNDGTEPDTALKTLERAMQRIRNVPAPNAVKVFPGKYYEKGELIVPEECAVVSEGGQFVTELIAQEGREETNMLLVNSGSYVQGFGFRNQRVDDLDDPSTGFAIAFAPGARIRRSPYIRDISQLGNFDPEKISAPLDPENANPLVGNGAGVLLADRAILDQNSTYPYMLAFGATPRTPNGIGYCAKNGAGINGISSLSIFSRVSFFALNGGQITLNNSGTQFGDISMRSTGTMPVVEPERIDIPLAQSDTAADTLTDNQADAIDAMWSALVDNGYVAGWSEQLEVFTRRDAGNLIKALALDLRAGTQETTQSFALGLFNYKAEYVFDEQYLDAFVFAWDELERYYEDLVPSSAQLTLQRLIGVVRDTVTNPTRIQFASLIESLGHQFNNAGAGVNKNALPLNFRRPGQNRTVPFTVLEEEGGRVRWSGSDELNNQYLAGGTRINGLTGRIEGRPFDAAVRQIARRIANTRGGF